MAFSGFLSDTTRQLRAFEDRQTWPPAIRVAQENPESPNSPFAVEVGFPPPVTMNEIVSLELPAGRWVVLFSSIHSAFVTYSGVPTVFWLISEFLQGDTVLEYQETSRFLSVTEPSMAMGASHGYAATVILTEDTTFSVRIAAMKQFVGGGMDWDVAIFRITAFPG